MVIHREQRVSGCSAGNLLASRRVRSMRITTGPGRGAAGPARRWPRLRLAAAAPGVPAAAPASPPASGWSGRPLQTAGSSLDSALAIALGLGSDRPDNAELLPQNGAARVGQDSVHGHRVEIMTGPDARAKAGTSST